MKEAIEKLEKVVEALYQKVDGSCPWCHAKDYPVCGDKQGYDEVKAEDAEEWQIDHSEDCIVTYLDQLLALLTEQPPAGDLMKEAIELDKMCISEIVAKYESSHNAIAVLKRKFREACARLDRSEAEIKSQAEHIELLNQCDDSSTEVIGKMDVEIEQLEESRKELLTACEMVARNNKAGKEGRINPEEQGDYWEVIIDTIEAAIKSDKEIYGEKRGNYANFNTGKSKRSTTKSLARKGNRPSD